MFPKKVCKIDLEKLKKPQKLYFHYQKASNQYRYILMYSKFYTIDKARLQKMESGFEFLFGINIYYITIIF